MFVFVLSFNTASVTKQFLSIKCFDTECVAMNKADVLPVPGQHRTLHVSAGMKESGNWCFYLQTT